MSEIGFEQYTRISTNADVRSKEYWIKFLSERTDVSLNALRKMEFDVIKSMFDQYCSQNADVDLFIDPIVVKGMESVDVY